MSTIVDGGYHFRYLTQDSVFSLITKLAKDLEGEFYPYFPRILSTILPLSRRPDASVLQVHSKKTERMADNDGYLLRGC